MEIEKNIAFFVQSHFPAIYRENGPELVQLVEDYYRFLENTSNQSVYVSRRFFDYKDINTTLASMFIYFQKKFLADLPLKEDVIRFIVKNILDLYRRKGTSAGIELFFALFYREYDIEIKYPSKYMLKASNAKWRRGVYLQMFPNDNSFLSSKTNKEYTYFDLLGRNITGSASGAKAAVSKINFIVLNGILTPIIYLDEVRGNFEKYDDIFTKISGEVVAFGRVNGSLSEIEIDAAYKGTTGNEIGDIVDVVADEYGDGGKAIVTEISNQFTGQISYDVIDGGWGYSIANTSLLVSNQVIILNNSALSFTPYERLEDTAGNQGIVTGQSETAVGVRLNTGQSFNISRPIRTLDRTPNLNPIPGILGVSAKNETSPGPLLPDTGNANNVSVSALTNTRTINVITDIITPFVGVAINAADYQSAGPMSGPASPVNLTTPLNQAFAIQAINVGTIVDFKNINPGEDYTNDVFSLAHDPVISRFDRRGQIITLYTPASASLFNVGEIITEANTGLTGIITSINPSQGSLRIVPYDYYGFVGNTIIKSNGDPYPILGVQTDYNSRPFGKNATIESETEFATGRIKKVLVYNSGFGYVDNDYVSLVDDAGEVQAKGTIQVDTQGITNGYWADNSSHLNGYIESANSQLSYFDSGMRIQDSDYYQEYSYLIRSTINPAEYEKLLKENVHLAGTKMFGDFIFKVKIDSPVSARFLRLFNDQGQGSPLDEANTSLLTADVINYFADSDEVTADNFRVI